MKKKIWLITAIVLMLTVCLGIFVACSNKEDNEDEVYIPNGSMIDVDSEEFTDYLVDIILNTVVPENDKKFYFNFLSTAEWKADSGANVKYQFGFQLNIDMANAESRDNAFKLFVEDITSGTPKNVFTIYYKDNLVIDGDQPNLYISIGEVKIAIDAVSIYDIFKGENNQSPMSESSLDSAKEAVNIIISLLFNDFQVRDYGDVMTMTLNIDTLYTMIQSLFKQYNADGEIDALLNSLGLNLTVEQLSSLQFDVKSLVTINITEELKIKNVDFDVIFNGEHPIVIEDLEGNKIIDILIESGKLELKITKIHVGGGEVAINVPENLDEYKEIRLLNKSIKGDFNFYKADGTANNDGLINKKTPIKVTLNMDINPFVLLRGITEETIADLGVFHLRAKGSTATFLEIIFDPKNTGSSNLYVIFNTRMVVGQKLTFDIDDTIAMLSELLAPKDAQNSISSEDGKLAIKDILSIGTIDRGDQSNLLVTVQLDPISEVLDSLLPGGIVIIPGQSGVQISTVLFGAGSSYATLEFTSFSYGDVPRDYNATVYVPNRQIDALVREVTGIVNVKTEYKQGEEFQYAVDSNLALNIINIKGGNGTLNSTVLKVEGYDPTKLGEQTIKVTVRNNTDLIAIIASVIEGGLPSGLPLGVLTYSYTINVVE